MKKATLAVRILLIIALAAINSLAQSGTPSYNVMDSPFLAKCDGSTDDTLAIHNCLKTASGAGGGTCMIPSGKTCAFNSTIKFYDPDPAHAFNNVAIGGAAIGSDARPGSGAQQLPRLIYTGTASPAISLQNTGGAALENLTIYVSNTGFTGTLIESCGAASCVTNDLTFKNLTLYGSGTGLLLSLDQSYNDRVENTLFLNAAVYVRGTASSASGDFSNVITFINNGFEAQPGTAFIQNPGANWNIIGNTFEVGTNPAVIQFVNGVLPSFGLLFSGNYIDDFIAQGTTNADMFNFPNTPAGNYNASGGYVFNANIFGTNSPRTFVFGNNLRGIVIEGNLFWETTTGPLITVGTGVSIDVGSNNYEAVITSFLSGTPAAGRVIDQEGQTTVYGGETVNGNLAVNGFLSKTGGSFRIDHPLDPAHKYLQHSFVESPDMKNIYDGVAILDRKGRAEVTLPNYFEALNEDFRYQLTCIGRPALVYVSREIKGNSFVIAGGRPGMRVSWQVTGIRHDAYANAHRIVVEEEKPAAGNSH